MLKHALAQKDTGIIPTANLANAMVMQTPVIQKLENVFIAVITQLDITVKNVLTNFMVTQHCPIAWIVIASRITP